MIHTAQNPNLLSKKTRNVNFQFQFHQQKQFQSNSEIESKALRLWKFGTN